MPRPTRRQAALKKRPREVNGKLMPKKVVSVEDVPEEFNIKQEESIIEQDLKKQLKDQESKNALVDKPDSKKRKYTNKSDTTIKRTKKEPEENKGTLSSLLITENFNNDDDAENELKLINKHRNAVWEFLEPGTNKKHKGYHAENLYLHNRYHSVNCYMFARQQGKNQADASKFAANFFWEDTDERAKAIIDWTNEFFEKGYLLDDGGQGATLVI